MNAPAILQPGSAEWYEHITPSKAAAIIGHSPYTSAYRLWHQMKGLVEPDGDSTDKSRGHYLEPAVLGWWFDQHPEYENLGTATQYTQDLPGFAANPDAIARHRDTGIVIPVEAKTSALHYEWGRGRTDVPRYYAAQGILTAHIMDAPTVAMPVLLAGLEFREYGFDYDPEVADWIIAECRAFLASLQTDQPPPMDSSSYTYDTYRQLHPGIADRDVDLPAPVGEQLLAARAAETAAETLLRSANLAVLQAMGDARRAKFDGHVVALRKANSPTGTPFLCRPPRQK